MGKAQSKRSVDITTETKKGPEGGEEVTGKLEKIEDIDQKQVNGDATPKEKSDAAGGGEKKDAPDETENDKDLTTEKSAAEAAAAAAATPTSPTTPATNGDGSGDQTVNETSPKEDTAAAAGGADATPVKAEGEEVSPSADEGSNKKKKEKTKKKFSFRSFSFGKKDRSKPKSESTENAPAAAATAEENAENETAAATNGEATETNPTTAEGAASDAAKTDEAAGATAAPAAADDKPKTVETEKIESNGVATEAEQKQMNGQKTPESSEETAAAAATAVAADQKMETNETSVAAAVVTSPPSTTTNDITANEKVEKIVSNGTAADAEKNGIAHHDEEKNHAEEKTTAVPAVAAVADESNSKSIPLDDEKPHQNGTNGDEAIEEINSATKTLQIEVKTVHPNDSNNSTTITSTTTITTNSSTNTTNTTTNTNTIHADQISNTVQKTVDDEKLLNTITNNTTIAHLNTDTNTSTTKNTTSNNSNSSKESIEKLDEEQIQNELKSNVESNENESCPSPSSISNIVNVVKEDELNSNDVEIDEIVVEKEENIVEEEQQQQQQPPPPLPITAPPSQVVIFALKDENNETSSTTETTIYPSIVVEPDDNENEIMKSSDEEKMIEPDIEIVETLAETTATINDDEQENFITITDSIELKLHQNENEYADVEIIKVGTLSLEEFADQLNSYVIEDFEAQALDIVDQIERDLEEEEAAAAAVTPIDDENVDEIKVEEIEEGIHNQQPIHMEICSESSQENLTPSIEETLDELPPPPAQLLNDEENDLNDEKLIIETLNECIGESNEIIKDSNEYINHQQQQQQHCHHNGEGDGDEKKKGKYIDMMENVQVDDNDDNLSNDMNINMLKETITNAAVVATSVAIADENIDDEHNNIVDEKCFVGDFNDKEMPTAKELKENAAAAEIKTQDLPVTCE